MTHSIDEFLEQLGAAIRFYRERKGLSQEKLAELADVDRTYISPIELGKQNPSVEVVFKIALALDVSMSRLMRRAEG